MKKTLTIQLGRSIYPIDEDAYSLLEEYLKDYRTHFALDEADERMKQLEARIAQFFSDKRDEGVLVVSLHEVEEVIECLHREQMKETIEEPQQPMEEIPLAEEVEEESFGFSSNRENSDGFDSASNGGAGNQQSSDASCSGSRRFCRNLDDKMVGGVLSGFAAYMGWEPTAVRLLFVVFAFLSLQVTVFTYLFSWMLMPVAPRQSEETKNGGEVPYEDVSVKVGSDRQTPTFLQSFCSGVAWIFAFLFKCLLVLMAIFAVPALLIFLFLFVIYLLGAFGVMITVPAFLYSYMPLEDFSLNPIGGSLMAVAGVLIIGIPLVALSYTVMHRKNREEEWSPSVRLTLLILWFAAWLVAGAGLFIGVMP